jgi:hypothetical protein
VVDTLRSLAADVICLQEVTIEQWFHLEGALQDTFICLRGETVSSVVSDSQGFHIEGALHDTFICLRGETVS